MKLEIQTLFMLALLFLIALPAIAHEGTMGDHLVLGFDTGIVLGIAIGFIAGVGATVIYFKNRSRDQFKS